MIDCENEVFDYLYTALHEQFPSAEITAQYVRAPAKFPHICIVMADSYPMQSTLDNTLTDTAETSMFQIDVYSNKRGIAKSECKTIMSVIDGLLMKKNFVRSALTQVPNLDDSTIFRLTARYVVVTDGEHFYRR